MCSDTRYQPTMAEVLIQFANEYLAKLPDPKPFQREPEPPESDEIRALREEYGNKLLVEQAKVEALKIDLGYRVEGLEQELAKVTLQRDEAQQHLRNAVGTLQRCYRASTDLHEALYGVGS